MVTSLHRYIVMTLLLSCFFAGAIFAQTETGTSAKTKPVRARLPKFEKFPADIFFKDAFREALVGTRPAVLGSRANEGGVATAPPDPTKNADSSGFAWSSFVSADTLEDEIKALQIHVDKIISTPGKFSSGGYQDARRAFTELAALFAVVGEYDSKVRWQKEAPQARDLFARAAANAKVTSTQAFNDAKQRKYDLQELVRGGTLSSNKPAAREANWELVCDRGPLMQRFTSCYDEGLALWTANAAEFKNNRSAIKHEAELLQTFAVALTKDGMEDAGDETYDDYCRQLGNAAASMLQALEDNDQPAARKAASNIGKSCSRCHDDYRA